jgi:Zn-dependent oligopeptidase
MKPSIDQNENKGTNEPFSKQQKLIESHKKMALLLQAAAQHHLDAAAHYEENDLDKAVISNGSAQEHLVLANEVQKENLKQYTLTLKPVL